MSLSQDKKPNIPEQQELDKRLKRLEKQVRREIDMRLICFLVYYSRCAQAVLTEEEMKVFINNLGLVIQNPNAKLSPALAPVFNKIDNDSQSVVAFESLSTLVQAKFHAEDINLATSKYLNTLLGRNKYGEMEQFNHDRSLRNFQQSA